MDREFVRVKLPHPPCRRLCSWLCAAVLLPAAHVGSAFELTEEEQAFLAEHPVIVVGGEMDWPPMDFAENGVHRGAAADYLEEISAITGIEFDVVVGYTWSELLALLRAKEVDVLPMMYWTEARGREFNLTNPYITVRHYVFTNGRRPDIKSFGDLHGLTVAIPADYAYIEYFGQHHPDIGILEVPTTLDALDAVVTGNADAVIENTASIAYYTATQSLIGLAPAFPVRFEVNNVHMAIRNDAPILRDILQKALDEVSAESTTRIMEKWTGSEAAAKTFLTAKAEFSRAERQHLRQTGVITACLNTNRMPLESVRNNQHEGMTSDYAIVLADTLKAPIATRVTENWQQAYLDLAQGKCDVITLAVRGENSADDLVYSEPYIEENLALATKVDESFYENLRELPASTLGVVSGYVDAHRLRSTYPELSFVEFATIDEALSAVGDGEVFGVLDYVPALSYAIRREYERTLKISGDFENESPGFSIATRSDEPLLASAINKVIQAMPDAQRQNIHRKWAAVSIDRQLDYKLFAQTAIVAAVVILLLLFRFLEIRRHRQQIQNKNAQLEIATSKLEERADSAMHMAHHDQLTGLPNRAKMLEDLDHSIKLCKRTGNKVALLFLDLDRFKIVNDTLGHDVGDQLLQAVATKIQPLLRETDTLCRLGGDEFVVILEAISDSYSPCIVARRIVEALSEEFLIGDHVISIGASIGIAICPDDSVELDTLVRYADSAMYSAKQNGRNGYQYYQHELSKTASWRVIMESALRQSLENQEFSLVYQPIVDLTEGAVAKGEALLRWDHPDLDNLSPRQFVPIVEKLGLIDELGEWVLRQVCQAIRALDAEGCGIKALSVNTSAVEFENEDVAARFARILDDYDIDPARIEIEITERHMLQRDPSFLAALEDLNYRGHEICVDDFGTDYSSISYMKRLPLGALKIDESFVKNIPFDQNDVEITEAVISLAHSLGYTVVAEGVETQEQLDFLLKKSCDYAQGHVFSAPVPLEHFHRSVQKINDSLTVDNRRTSRPRRTRSQ